MRMLSKPLLAFLFVEDQWVAFTVNGAECCPGTDWWILRHCCVYEFNSRYCSKANLQLQKNKRESMRDRRVKGMKKYGRQEGKGLEEEDSYTSLLWEPRATMCLVTIAI